MRIVVLLCACLAVSSLAGCRSQSKEDILSQAPGAQDGKSDLAYEKPEGVAFHIPAILGMRYSQFRGSEMETYLGQQLEEVRLPGIRGRQFKYGQGEVYVARDIIYQVGYEFPRPVSRIDAVHLTGLPESLLAELKPTSLEQRIERSAYGYRRLVLTRAEPEADQYIRIDAWKFLPGERF
jgi:hypothetical protein